jgi:ribose transport system substrate-binding protein
LKTIQADISGRITFMWITLTFVGVAAVSWIGITATRRIRKRWRRSFLVTSAFSQKYYVAAFVQRLHSAFDRHGIDLVLKVPDRDYDASAQSHHLDRLLDRRHDYIGGIIVASEVHRLRDDLTMFCRKSRLPVVFTDLEPFDKESDYPENSAYIGYDTGELGELAGRWLALRLKERNVRGSLSSRAYDSVCAHIRALDSRQCLSAIFCTNDEMALGAVDALSSVSSPAIQSTVVVGIDGVLEAKALIDSAHSPLCATVVQDTHRLAVTVVDTLVKMHRGRTMPKRTILHADVYETS